MLVKLTPWVRHVKLAARCDLFKLNYHLKLKLIHEMWLIFVHFAMILAKICLKLTQRVICNSKLRPSISFSSFTTQCAACKVIRVWHSCLGSINFTKLFSTSKKLSVHSIWQKKIPFNFTNNRPLIDSLEQCFSTFFGSRHPLWQKIFGGTPQWVNYYFEAPLVSIIAKFH